MKAISIKEPWATLILKGKKTIETRTWKTKYRGKLLLCCSKKPKSSSNIHGKAFVICDLVSVKQMKRTHEKQACCGIYPRANSWFLENIKPIEPFEVKGQMGLFFVNPEILRKIKKLKEGS